MREGQWRLTYPAWDRYAGADLTFGTLDTGYPLRVVPDVQLAGQAPTGEQTRMPYEDGFVFGQEFSAGAAITLEIGVDTAGQESAHTHNLDAVGVFTRAWDAPAVRMRAQSVAELRAHNGGRTRVAYGRPTKCAPARGKVERQGYTPVVAEFTCQGSKFYEDTVHAHRVDFVPPSTGGLTSPLTSPLSTVPSSASKPGQIVVGGDQPTELRSIVYGPITDPVIEVLDLWRIELKMTLGVDQWVRIDPRPWARTVLNQDGGGVAGKMTRQSPRMADMVLTPGQWHVVLRGTDATGTSYLTVDWQDAYSWL